MAALNPVTRELLFKLVFYGPGLGGKTTTLQYIHAATKTEHKGKMVSLSTPTDRTLYFDFLPIRVPRVRGMGVRLQLFTVPGQVQFAATRKLVLAGVDGVVFVADSQRGRLRENDESLEDLQANLAEHGKSLEDVPHIYQWNKRDLGDLVPVEELERRYDPEGAPALATVATKGDGVFEGLERITRLVMTAFEAEIPKAEAQSIGWGPASDAGIADAIRGLTESALPVTRTLPAIPNTEPDLDAPLSQGLLGLRASLPVVTAAPGSGLPVQTGSYAAQISSPGEIAPFSFAPLFPEVERESVHQTEFLLAAGDARRAVLSCETLMTRALASAAHLSGSPEAPRDPGLVAMLLGIDGTRYVAFRHAVRAARQRGDVSLRDAFEAYALALDTRRARATLAKNHR